MEPGLWTSKLKDVDPMVANLFGCLMNITLLPFLFFDPALSFGTKPILIILALGIFQFGLGGIIFATGMRHSNAITASIIGMIEPILNPIWVFLAVGEHPGALSVFGAAIVIITIAVYNILCIKRAQATALEQAH